MCAILGIVGNITDKDIGWINKASFLLKHRGPDFGSSWLSTSKNALFAHRRLSIIDTGNQSNQPFLSDDNQLIISFNGEIYNYIEIREELISLGDRFKTSGDTEVLLASYRRWGAKCLDRLNGMFAFAIWDQRRGVGNEKLFIARDRSGEKPFYYRHKPGRFEFSSELKGLEGKGTLDPQGLNHYLALGYVPGELCIVNGVKKLPPAHAGLLDISSGKLEIWNYWIIPEISINNSINKIDLADKVWSLLNESVKIRLRSDVETGVFLSGGLDSSLVTASASSVTDKTIKTFSISVPGSSMDETKHAKLIADYFGTDHHVLEINTPSLETLNEFSSLIDEPIADSSIIPSFLVSKLTGKHVKVALGGDGGDELFGGYTHYQDTLRNNRILRWFPKSVYTALGAIAEHLPAGVSGRNYICSLQKGAKQSRVWGTPFFDINLRKKLFTKDYYKLLQTQIKAPEKLSLSLLPSDMEIVDSLTRMDFQQQLPDDYLVKVDRASMANSLEVRCPFLDHHLIEFAFSKIPHYWKSNLKERRPIQNLLAKKHLPKDFIIDRKQGFSIPMDNWMQKVDLNEYLNELPKAIFNKNFIENLIKGQRNGRTNGARLFSLLMLTYAGKNSFEFN